MCIPTTESCKLDCANGCVEEKYNEDYNCAYRCPNPLIIKKVYGQYMSCECPGGGVFKDEDIWCREKPKSYTVLIVVLCVVFT